MQFPTLTSSQISTLKGKDDLQVKEKKLINVTSSNHNFLIHAPHHSVQLVKLKRIGDVDASAAEGQVDKKLVIKALGKYYNGWQ